MHINLNYYYIFYEVATFGNISAAARHMNVSQPSVSRTISVMETQLGFPLFIRSKNGVVLTSEGKTLFDQVVLAIEHIEKAELITSETSEILTIAASPLTMLTVIPPIMESFKESNPNIRFKVTTSSTGEAVRKLDTYLADLAIIPSPVVSNPDYETIPIYSFDNILIGGTKYSNLKNKVLKLDELTKNPFICLNRGTAGRQWLDSLLLKHDVVIKPDIEVPTSDLIPSLVKHNLGLAFCARVFAEEGLAKGEIIKLDTEIQLPQRSFLLCYKKVVPRSPACKQFCEYILSHDIDFFYG